MSHEADHSHVVEATQHTGVFPRPQEDGHVVSAEERQVINQLGHQWTNAGGGRKRHSSVSAKWNWKKVSDQRQTRQLVEWIRRQPEDKAS